MMLGPERWRGRRSNTAMLPSDALRTTILRCTKSIDMQNIDDLQQLLCFPSVFPSLEVHCNHGGTLTYLFST